MKDVDFRRSSRPRVGGPGLSSLNHALPGFRINRIALSPHRQKRAVEEPHDEMKSNTRTHAYPVSKIQLGRRSTLNSKLPFPHTCRASSQAHWADIQGKRQRHLRNLPGTCLGLTPFCSHKLKSKPLSISTAKQRLSLPLIHNGS